MSQRMQLVISGHVQGVFYRVSTQKKARQLNLTGFVRNLPGGHVEVLAEGEPERLKNLAEWCLVGPPYARVDHVNKTILPSQNEHKCFKII